MNMSPAREAFVLQALVNDQLITPEDIASCEEEAKARREADPEDTVTALDLIVERGLVSMKTVNSISAHEQMRSAARYRKANGVILGAGGVFALLFACYAMWSASDRFGGLDDARLIVSRPDREAIMAGDESRATYLQRKNWEIREGDKYQRQRELAREKLHDEELVRQAEEERRRAEATRQQSEAEAAARAEAERLRQEAEAAARKRNAEALSAERIEFERVLSEVENYARIFKYRKALEEYRALRATLQFRELQERVDRRIAEVEKLASMMDRLWEAVNQKTLRNNKVQFGETEKEAGTISAATEEYLEVTIPQGFIRTRWDFMRPVQIADLFRRLSLKPDEELLLGFFCYEAGLIADSWPLFLSVEKQRPELKASVDEFLASKRGFAGVPPGGFVHHQGRLVTVEEKDYFERGFIYYGNQWIKPDERVYVDKGWVKQDTKWIPREEADLLARGYRKYKEKWYSAEELAELRSHWVDAWETETEHYKIRTNTTEAFAAELALVMEQAFEAYQVHYNRKHSGPKMNIFAFREFEDYRSFCIENKLESHIAAQGHASGAGNYGCGYPRYNGLNELIGTLIHEGSHLFYDRAVQGFVPSWYHEGQATYFEGYTWDGKTLTFNHVSPMRLPWLRRALAGGTNIPLRELIKGDALSSIQKGAQDSMLFYSQSWGLYYFLCHTNDDELKKKFADLREKYASRALGPSVMQPDGSYSSFTNVVTSDFDALEAKWKAFIAAIPD